MSKPGDPAPGSWRLGTAASKWTKTQLDLLNATYIPQTTNNFHFESMPISSELAQRTFTYTHRTDERNREYQSTD